MAAEKLPPPTFLPPSAEGSAAERLATRVLAAYARQQQRDGELSTIVRLALRPGGETKWTALRRVLALCGHRRAPTHSIALAVLEQHDGAFMSRGGPKGKGARTIRGVSLSVNVDALRTALTSRWEEQLVNDGLPPELAMIAQEYKLGPLYAAMGGRFAEIVTRVHDRRADASVYYAAADEYLHRCGWGRFPAGQKAIWQRHCEGARRRDIAKELQLHDSYVQRVIDLHRARCGLVHR